MSTNPNVNKTGDHTLTGTIGSSPVSIGRFTYGLEHLGLREWGEKAKLTVGSFCSISSKVTVMLGGNHRIDWITTFPFGHVFLNELGSFRTDGHPSTNGDVTIGNDVWIGHGVTIMSGVSVGDGAVIAANSHVVKDVMPYEIVGGNPAKSIRKRFNDDIIELLLKLRWWDLPTQDIKTIAKDICAEPTPELLLGLIQKYRS